MFEDKLNKIIASFERDEQQPEHVDISMTELLLLADVFDNPFPEKIRSFTLQLSTALKEKNEKIVDEVLDENKEAINYLNSVNKILIANNFNEALLQQLDQTYNYSSSTDKLTSFRGRYLEQLAELNMQGKTSSTIQHLLENPNPVFIQHSEFIADVKTATRIMEREQLKKIMRGENEIQSFDLNDEEIRSAVRMIERKKLTEMMDKINIEQKDENIEGKDAKIIPLQTSFNWKRLAAAAVVIGVIATTAIIIINNKKPSPGIVINKPDTTVNKKNIKDDRNTGTEIASFSFDTVQRVMNVNKESALGFAVKQEKITVIINKISFSAAAGSLPDSVKRLLNNYLFRNNQLTIYLSSDSLSGLYKVDTHYFIELNNLFYQIQPGDQLRGLKKITDANISERINKIKFQKNN